MRRRSSLLLLPLTLAVLPLLGGACSTFGADPEHAGPTPDADASTSPDGTDPVKGAPDRGLTITVGEPKATAFVIQNGALDLPVKLTRRESTTGAVVVTVTNLPPDVTAETLTIPTGKTEGTLTLRAKATSLQGGPKIADIKAVEEGALGSGASTTLPTFVRGGHGALDTTFGDKGTLIQLYGMGSEADAFDAKTLKDGSILVGARARTNLVLSRFSPSGALDSSFPGGGTLLVIPSQGFAAFDVIEPPSPATGWIYFLQGNGSSSPLIVRLNLDGTRDTKFNGNGQTVLADPGAGAVLVPQQVFALPDGRALVSHQRAGAATTVVSRWNPDGTRDESYGTSGVCAIAGYGRMLLRSAGAVFMTGNKGMQGCTPNGLLDETIGIAPNYAAKAGGAEAVDIARTPSGGVAFLNVKSNQNVLNRLTPALDKDASIGTLGDVFTPLSQSASNLSNTLLVQKDGGVLIGTPAIGDAQRDTVSVLRYTSKGVLDTTFGTAGTATFTISGGAQLTKLVAQPDGRILALGKSDQTGFDAAMFRFWP